MKFETDNSLNSEATRDHFVLQNVYYLILFILITSTFLYLYYHHPIIYLRLITEDHWGEYGTAFCFLFAAVILFALLRRHGALPHKIVWSLSAVAFLLIAGEEISWGQRLFDLNTPDILMRTNQQGELNLHNIRGVSEFRIYFSYVIVAWCLFSVVMSCGGNKLIDLEKRWGVPVIRLGIIPFALMFPYLRFYDPIVRSDEIGELFLSMTALLWALDLRLRTTGPEGRTVGRVVGASISMLVGVAVFSIIASELLPRSGNPAWRIRKQANHYYERFELPAQAEEILRFLSARPTFYTVEVRLDFARVLRVNGKAGEARSVLVETRDVLRTRIESGDRSARTFRQLGIVNDLLGDRDGAQAAFAQAIEADRNKLLAVSDQDKKAKVLWSLAMTMAARGDDVSAEETANEALAVAKSERVRHQIRRWLKKLYSDQDKKAKVLLSLAMTMAARGDDVSAEETANEALAVAKSERVRRHIRRWLKKLY